MTVIEIECFPFPSCYRLKLRHIISKGWLNRLIVVDVVIHKVILTGDALSIFKSINFGSFFAIWFPSYVGDLAFLPFKMGSVSNRQKRLTLYPFHLNHLSLVLNLLANDHFYDSFVSGLQLLLRHVWLNEVLALRLILQLFDFFFETLFESFIVSKHLFLVFIEVAADGNRIFLVFTDLVEFRLWVLNVDDGSMSEVLHPIFLPDDFALSISLGLFLLQHQDSSLYFIFCFWQQNIQLVYGEVKGYFYKYCQKYYDSEDNKEGLALCYLFWQLPVVSWSHANPNAK